MAYPHLALRLDRKVLVSHYVVAGSKNPTALAVWSVKVRLSKGDYVEARMFSLDHYDALDHPDEAISLTIEKMINDLQK